MSDALNKSIEYPVGIRPVRLPVADLRNWGNFIQFEIGRDNLPVFWTGSPNQNYSDMAINASSKITETCRGYSVVGSGKIFRPECDIVSLSGDNVSKEHLISLAEYFPRDVSVDIEGDGLLIRCRRVFES